MINAVEPWVSDEDIATGAHWPTDIHQGLQESKFGMICITPDNISKPWILFEAGALSKAIDQSQVRVCPYLFGIEKPALKPPLGHFQSAKADKPDTLKLVRSINETVKAPNGRSLIDHKLESAFEKWWPDLEHALAAIQLFNVSQPEKRTDRELLEEVLETVRAISRNQKKGTSQAMAMFVAEAWRNRKAANLSGLEGSSADVSNPVDDNLCGLEECAYQLERTRQAFINDLNRLTELQRRLVGNEKK